MKAQPKRRRAICLAIIHSVFVSSLILHSSSLFAQGGLTPPGAPGPTMKTLDQVEPRRPLKQSDFPLVTNGPMNAYLTEDVTITALDTTGITINSSNVTIDLNGFTLTGPGSSAGASGDGILCNSAQSFKITIMNGNISNWRGDGIDLSLSISSKVEGVQAFVNGGNGVKVGKSCFISECAAQTNHGNGIETGDACAIDRCTAQANGVTNAEGDGLKAGKSCTISDCTAQTNYKTGIEAGDGSSISGCVVDQQGYIGIQAGVGATIFNSVATGNYIGISTGFSSSILNCSASGNDTDGISAGPHGRVTDCTAEQNTYSGISAGPSSAVTNCSSYGNGTGIDVNSSSAVTNCNGNSNLGDGFSLASGCMVVNCSGSSNGGDGFNFGAGCSIMGSKSAYNAGNGFHATPISPGSSCMIDGNNATGNTLKGFLVDGAGNFVVRNTAHGNTGGHFSMVPGQTAGAIVGSGGTISADPWSNFNF